jgi:ribosomal protein S18 acetylase RimI-like enzyme
MKPRIPTSIKRIFLKEDAQEIFRLQEEADVFKRHYPDHRKWLRKAMNEVLAGYRTAFGAYVIKAVDSPDVRLVGTCILKPPDLSSTVEIKNLYVEPEYQRNGCGTLLYKEVEEYCGRSGASRIRVEVPGSEIDTLSWLLKRGFEFSHKRESNYVQSDVTYYLERVLPPYYQGDWFDHRALAKWTLSHLYGFKVAENSDSTLERISFEQYQSPNAFLRGNFRLPIVRGELKVAEASRSGDAALPSTIHPDDKNNFLVVFAENLSLVSEMILPHGTLVIDKQELRALRVSSEVAVSSNRQHPRLGYDPPSFSSAEIAGLIVNITSSILDRFYATVARDVRFSYFKTGPVGKYLKEGNRLLIYREPTTSEPTEGIFGFAEVVKVLEGKPDSVWKDLTRENPAMSEDEYMRYWGYKNSIVGIVAQDFVRIEPIPHREIRAILELDIDMMALGHCYLSHKMLELLRLEDRRRRLDQIYNVALSFPSQDRKIAERLFALLTSKGLSVFYDRDAEVRMLGADAMDSLFDVFNHQSMHVVILCSKWTKDSEWAKYEMQLALNRERRQGSKHGGLVIPVRLDEEEVPFLTTRIFADARKKSLEDIADLIYTKVISSSNTLDSNALESP